MKDNDMADELRVRIGTPEDVHELMDIAMMACEENGFLDPNPMRILEQIYSALCQHQGIVGVIGKPNDKIEGAVLLRIGSLWYSDQEVIEEKAIFIHPDYRNAKGGRARRLCEFSKQVADNLGLPLMIGVLSNDRTAAKVRMYQRQFGPASGAYWLYGGKTGEWQSADAEQTGVDLAPVS